MELDSRPRTGGRQARTSTRSPINHLNKMAQEVHHLWTFLLLLMCMPDQIHSKTLASDTQALLFLKSSVDPSTISSSSFLNTWDFSSDPCENLGSRFLGVLCMFPPDNSSSRITTLILDTAGYDGFLTPAIGNLLELTILNLNNNKFRGPLPQNISRLTKLTQFSISNNFFTGRFPAGILTFKKIEVLDLSHNEFSGTIPPALSGLRGLVHLGLSGNRFSGHAPNLQGLWQLTTLDLSGNRFSGRIPKVPVNLRALTLSKNLLSGHLPQPFSFPFLQSLDLSDNRLSGVISGWLLELPELRHIDVSNNHFTSLEILNFSGQASQLEVLDAHGNAIRGQLPLNLVTMQSLTSIYLQNNRFKGPIPLEFGEKVVDTWRTLFLNDNYLVGKLPLQFRKPPLMFNGSLANNCLTCPARYRLCQGERRTVSECIVKNGHYDQSAQRDGYDDEDDEEGHV